MGIIAEDVASWGQNRQAYQAQAVERRAFREAKVALSHLCDGLQMWIGRGTANPERTLREMRQVQDRVEEILNG